MIMGDIIPSFFINHNFLWQCEVQFPHLFISLNYLRGNDHNTLCICVFSSFSCVMFPHKVKEFDSNLQVMYSTIMDVKVKFQNSCFGFMCQTIANEQRYSNLEALISLPNEEYHLNFWNEKHFPISLH